MYMPTRAYSSHARPVYPCKKQSVQLDQQDTVAGLYISDLCSAKLHNNAASSKLSNLPYQRGKECRRAACLFLFQPQRFFFSTNSCRFHHQSQNKIGNKQNRHTRCKSNRHINLTLFTLARLIHNVLLFFLLDDTGKPIANKYAQRQ